MEDSEAHALASVRSHLAAQTVGPALGGGLVGLLGAPIAIVVDSISYLVDAALNASIRVEEPKPSPRKANLGVEIREALNSTYRHQTLGRLAMSTHTWSIANGAAMTALSIVALRTLGFSAFIYGLLPTGFGVTGFIGASLAPRFGTWLGSGRVIILARAIYPIGWLLVAIAPPAAAGASCCSSPSPFKGWLWVQRTHTSRCTGTRDDRLRGSRTHSDPIATP